MSAWTIKSVERAGDAHVSPKGAIIAPFHVLLQKGEERRLIGVGKPGRHGSTNLAADVESQIRAKLGKGWDPADVMLEE
jgi:hypothetical protein